MQTEYTRSVENINCSNMHVIGDPGGEQRENWIQDKFGETVAKNFPKMLLVPQLRDP